MAHEICQRLHFSNVDTEQIEALVANHMRFSDVERMKTSTLKRFLRLPEFDEHLELHRVDCLSSHRDLSLYTFVSEKLRTTPPDEIRPCSPCFSPATKIIVSDVVVARPVTSSPSRGAAG